MSFLILRSFSEADARNENDTAQAYLDATVEDYTASRWSDIYVNADDTEYGIAWEDRLIPAFTPEELGTEEIVNPDGTITYVYTNVISIELATPDSPGWMVLPDPEEPLPPVPGLP